MCLLFGGLVLGGTDFMVLYMVISWHIFMKFCLLYGFWIDYIYIYLYNKLFFGGETHRFHNKT